MTVSRPRTGTFLALLLSWILILSLFPPLEFIDYVYWAFALGFSIAPEVFIMLSDLLLLLAGYLLSYSLTGFLFTRPRKLDVLDSFSRMNRGGIPSLIAAALIIVYWHVPTVLDAALLNFELHVIMHFSLLVAGSLIFLGANLLADRTRKIMSILGCKAMGIFGVFLLVTSGTGYGRFYSVYPISQQAQLGLSMMIMMFVFEGFLVPYWLYQYFNHDGEKPISRN
jgi:cytochrome c oxidase assembly factor CtaG